MISPGMAYPMEEIVSSLQGKRKRADQPLSPIERMQAQADKDDGEDLDNYRQHKRYITEVRAGTG